MRQINKFLIIIFLYIMTIVFTYSITVQEEIDKDQKVNDTKKNKSLYERLKFNGDARFRFESDWDSNKGTIGDKRIDRDRFRYRFRLGFNYSVNENYSFGGRIRSGNPANQQSPHETLGDEFEPDSMSIDKAYLKAKYAFGWLWLGKNSLPFWKQNEIFWDSDVLPEGIAAGFKFSFAEKKYELKPTAAYFIVRDRRTLDFDGDGVSDSISFHLKEQSYLAVGQLAFDAKFSENTALNAAGGYFDFKGIIQPADVGNPVDLTNSRLLDYTIIYSGLKFVYKGLFLPITFGVDAMKNLRSYPDDTQLGSQTLGYVASLKFGKLKKRYDFLVGYYFVHIQKYAVVDFLAGDDFLRWTTNSATNASNYQAHEFRLAYCLAVKVNLVARLYLVKGIKKNLDTDDRVHDGKRFRLDFNMGF